MDIHLFFPKKKGVEGAWHRDSGSRAARGTAARGHGTETAVAVPQRAWLSAAATRVGPPGGRCRCRAGLGSA